MADESFAVDQRAVRKRFTLIAEKFEKRVKNRKKPVELEEIISCMKETQHEVDAMTQK